MIYFIRKHDFKFYVLLTLLSTLLGVSTIYLLRTKFGSINFSDFAVVSIVIQIIFTISDFGLKVSYFKPGVIKMKSEFKYIVIVRLFLALFLFFFISIFQFNSIYFSFVLTIIGTSIFPNFLLQEYKLYTVVSVNNLIFRALPLLFLDNFTSIEQFSLFSGFCITSFSLVVILKLKVHKGEKVIFSKFRSYLLKTFSQNVYLSAINIISILEVYLHVLLANYLFPKNIFADFMFIERFINYLKQSVIYLYEFLFPKINLNTLRKYQSIIRVLNIIYIISVLIAVFSNIIVANDLLNIKTKNLLIIFLIYPLSILMFNFLSSILYYKYANDKYNLLITVGAFSIKFILIIVFFNILGIIIIPISLIISEAFMGVSKYFSMPNSLKSQLRFI